MQVRVIRARSIAFQARYSRTKNLLHSTKFIFEIYGPYRLSVPASRNYKLAVSGHKNRRSFQRVIENNLRLITLIKVQVRVIGARSIAFQVL